MILAPLAAIATAVFGITYTAQTAAAAGNSAAAASDTARQAAEQRAATTTEAAGEAESAVGGALERYQQLIQQLEQGGSSVTGSRTLNLLEEAVDPSNRIEIGMDELHEIERRLVEARARLDALS